VVPVEELRKDPDWSKWVGVQEVSVTDSGIGSFELNVIPTFSGLFGWVLADHCWVRYNPVCC